MRPRPRRLATTLPVLAALVALASLHPARPAGAAPDPAKTFHFAGAGFRSLDPAKVSTPLEERLTLACFDPLTRVDPTTGKVGPCAAASYEASADGRTWTFHLRPGAKWVKAQGGEEKGDVVAADFVGSWLRLLDPETVSPNGGLLDAIPGCRSALIDGIRGTELDKISVNLLALMGSSKNQSVKGADVVNFVNDVTNQLVRKWCAACADPLVQKLLAWQEKDPMVPVKVKDIAAAIDKEAKAARASSEDAKSHVGKDRGFYAKDPQTLVVEVVGVSPWLPSLLARAGLAPVHLKTVERRRELAFQNYNFVCNGAYGNTGELAQFSKDSPPPAFRVVLTKIASHWNAAAAPMEQIVCEVPSETEPDIDFIAKDWGSGSLQWAPIEIFQDLAPKLRAAKVPGWKPAKPTDACFGTLAQDLYEISGRGVYMLRFRCTPPLDRPDVRKALASLVDRAALAKLTPTGSAPLAPRLVPSRVTGVLPNLPLPTFDSKTAKTLYGSKQLFPGENWLHFLFSGNDGAVGDTLVKAWKKPALPDDVTAYTASGSDLREQMDQGAWNAVLSAWLPDYDDPLAYLSGFTSGSPVGNTGWSDARFDALIRAAQDVAGFAAGTIDPAIKDLAALQAQAKGGGDAAEQVRRRLLFEAEARLLSEAVVVPLWTTVESGIVKAKVRGLSGLGDLSGQPRSILDIHPIVGAMPGE